MITGSHVIIYSRDAEADRAFFQEVLKYPHVDAGGGWLIFKLPPGEVAVHPTEGGGSHELYLMCDDVNATVEDLKASGVNSADAIGEPMTSTRGPPRRAAKSAAAADLVVQAGAGDGQGTRGDGQGHAGVDHRGPANSSRSRTVAP